MSDVIWNSCLGRKCGEETCCESELEYVCVTSVHRRGVTNEITRQITLGASLHYSPSLEGAVTAWP